MSFLNNKEIAQISLDFTSAFDAFSREVTVHKAGLKTPVTGYAQSNGLFGFGSEQQESEFTYTPVNQTFQCVVRYKSNVNQSNNPDLGAFYSKGGISIRVKADCAAYILQDKTEKIQVDGRSWATIGPPETRKFLTNEYYIFYLQNVT